MAVAQEDLRGLVSCAGGCCPNARCVWAVDYAPSYACCDVCAAKRVEAACKSAVVGSVVFFDRGRRADSPQGDFFYSFVARS